MLVRAGRDGMPAGDIARATGVRPNTLSTNLSILSHAGLVVARREGRSVIYTAAYERINELVTFLGEDFFGGDLEGRSPGASAGGAPDPAGG